MTMPATPIHPAPGVRLHPSEKRLAIHVACNMLRIDPASFVRDELAELCVDTADVWDACNAMRDAAEHDRVTAALRLLRERKAARS